MVFGSSDDGNNIAAYSRAFFSYSTFDFLDTWIRREMNESAVEIIQRMIHRLQDMVFPGQLRENIPCNCVLKPPKPGIRIMPKGSCCPAVYQTPEIADS